MFCCKIASYWLRLLCACSFALTHHAYIVPTGRPLVVAPSMNQDNVDDTLLSRRRLFGTILTSAAMSSLMVQPANAEDNIIIWNTGKDPIVPGKKPRDKSDVSGTRKDPSFLRSIADCKNQCEQTVDSEGLAKSKEDCLSECQDICCTTYQQCTFAIVPRI